MEMTPVDLKEELIQSGKMHYSDMLSREPEPTRWHSDLFTRALDSGAARLAREVSYLARELARRAGDEPIVLGQPRSELVFHWGGNAAPSSACDG
uniref:Putative ATP/GTP-binding protein n=1 Tax=Klebsiella pneumoniae TaxID=573 RepID=A0A8B0SVF1_KLEPN|nr:putative ATP/GTP-binding protein [Klebsiella pneumoniae]